LLSFANAFRRSSSSAPAPLPVNQPPPQSISRRTSKMIGQAIQAVAQLQQQSSNSSLSSLSSNNQQQVPQRPSDGLIKFRAYFDIKEETMDSKGNLNNTSVPR
jgi:hypothetical protein